MGAADAAHNAGVPAFQRLLHRMAEPVALNGLGYKKAVQIVVTGVGIYPIAEFLCEPAKFFGAEACADNRAL
jgi:hypothetical protein